MFDLMMIAYILVLVGMAALVGRYFPPLMVADTFDIGLGPIGGLVAFAFLATPVAGAYLLPEFLRTWLSPFIRPDWTERLAQIAAPVLTIYIMIRGIVVWAGVALLAGILWVAMHVVQYLSGK